MNTPRVLHRLPVFRREAAAICELCRHRVLAFPVAGGVAVVLVDPSKHQRLMADLVVLATRGAAYLAALPPWNWCQRRASYHKCPPPGQGPADAEAEARARRRRDDDANPCENWEVP